jgi:DNA-binding transcriptional MerR regulator
VELTNVPPLICQDKALQPDDERTAYLAREFEKEDRELDAKVDEERQAMSETSRDAESELEKIKASLKGLESSSSGDKGAPPGGAGLGAREVTAMIQENRRRSQALAERLRSVKAVMARLEQEQEDNPHQLPEDYGRGAGPPTRYLGGSD